MAKRLRRKTGQYQNSEQAGYSQAANPEVGQSRLVDGHPANAERNKEQARRVGSAGPFGSRISAVPPPPPSNRPSRLYSEGG